MNLEALWWTLSLLLMGAGLVGMVFPALPDSLLILAGAFLHHFTIRAEHSVGWWTLGVLTALMVLAHVVDFVAGALGAKRFGSSRWGVLGGFIGSIVGLFFFPIGLFLGPVAGVLVAEVILARKTLGPAARSSWGTLLGTVAGMMGKAVIDFTMIAVFLLGLRWHV